MGRPALKVSNEGFGHGILQCRDLLDEGPEPGAVQRDRRGNHDQRGDALAVIEGNAPRREAAPGVADEHGTGDPKGVQRGDDVGSRVFDAIAAFGSI